jgi:hypothetical protein
VLCYLYTEAYESKHAYTKLSITPYKTKGSMLEAEWLPKRGFESSERFWINSRKEEKKGKNYQLVSKMLLLLDNNKNFVETHFRWNGGKRFEEKENFVVEGSNRPRLIL